MCFQLLLFSIFIFVVFTAALAVIYRVKLAILQRQRTEVGVEDYLNAFDCPVERQIALIVRDWLRSRYIYNNSFPVLPGDSLELTYGVDPEEESEIRNLLDECKRDTRYVSAIAASLHLSITELVKLIKALPEDSQR